MLATCAYNRQDDQQTPCVEMRMMRETMLGMLARDATKMKSDRAPDPKQRTEMERQKMSQKFGWGFGAPEGPKQRTEMERQKMSLNFGWCCGDSEG